MPRLKFSKTPRTSVECLDCCLDFAAPLFSRVMSLEAAVPPTKVKDTTFCKQTVPASFPSNIMATAPQNPKTGESTLTAALASEKMAIPCLPRQYG
ncbi:hypothetical protein B9Z19DRAFT_1099168 [Tuber borchii]|uniref:Uncharacterized protein n=1 Tax=Tuber borchii TaxID=42251 RepID=A0A2T7A407_TUBBO|nr:hypothetical protein B9Z19DRAFT_1099168 [Tuber borchii]